MIKVKCHIYSYVIIDSLYNAIFKHGYLDQKKNEWYSR